MSAGFAPPTAALPTRVASRPERDLPRENCHENAADRVTSARTSTARSTAPSSKTSAVPSRAEQGSHGRISRAELRLRRRARWSVPRRRTGHRAGGRRKVMASGTTAVRDK